MPVVAFENATAENYGKILEAQGFSRRKILDRMIGAQALGLKAKLITFNPDDFSNIEGLDVVGW
jgi:tRNA(fMet)-specific endonuclease VapC